MTQVSKTAQFIYDKLKDDPDWQFLSSYDFEWTCILTTVSAASINANFNPPAMFVEALLNTAFTNENLSRDLVKYNYYDKTEVQALVNYIKYFLFVCVCIDQFYKKFSANNYDFSGYRLAKRRVRTAPGYIIAFDMVGVTKDLPELTVSIRMPLTGGQDNFKYYADFDTIAKFN